MPPGAYPALRNDDDLAAAISRLTRKCRYMRTVYARTGQPPLRDYPANLEGLAKIVVGQQLSAASAAAIWGRVALAIQPFRAEQLLRRNEGSLRKLGLSAGKIRTLRAIATAVAGKELQFARLNKLPDQDIHTALTALHGVGPWTADIYILFALRRADAFPAGDLALQIAVQKLFALETRPSAATLGEIAQRWQPWRGAAARLLWADYALFRARGPAETGRGRKPTP